MRKDEERWEQGRKAGKERGWGERGRKVGRKKGEERNGGREGGRIECVMCREGEEEEKERRKGDRDRE